MQIVCLVIVFWHTTIQVMKADPFQVLFFVWSLVSSMFYYEWSGLSTITDHRSAIAPSGSDQGGHNQTIKGTELPQMIVTLSRLPVLVRSVFDW